jgi:hypothetical protein
MPIGTCDPASRGDAYNSVTLEERAPNGSGSVLTDVRYGWDGTSVMPNCDGPVSYLRTRNTSNMTAWAMLPNKKRGSKWVQIDPGTDATITAAGTLRNLGLENYSDVAGVGVQWTQPVA